jgi:hypothetical protein
MSYHRLPTAPLASRHTGAGGGTVDKRRPPGSTYIRPESVQPNGATSHIANIGSVPLLQVAIRKTSHSLCSPGRMQAC